MAIKNAVRIPIKGTIVDAGVQDLLSPRVPEGQIHCYQHMTWGIDKTTSGGNTRCSLYIEGHGYKHYFAEQDAPTATDLYSYPYPVWLVPGERLGLEIDQGQASTTAQMWLTGYWVKFEEGLV